MSVIFHLENITESEVDSILRGYKAVVRPEYGQASLKARCSAAQLRKDTWQMYSMGHVNALLMGLRNIKYSRSYDVMQLIAVAEHFSYAMIGQCGLTYEEFNLVIGPLASTIAPELFVEEQFWRLEDIPPMEYKRPYYPESVLRQRARRTVAADDVESGIGALVDRLVTQAVKAMPSEKRMVPPEIKAAGVPAIDMATAMLEAIKSNQ